MLNFTRQEKQIILFLASIALLGIGMSYLRKTHCGMRAWNTLFEELGKVDLNHADVYLLKSVPGIGEKLCQRILAYRQEKGCFKSVEEIKDIRGMSEEKYERIKDYLVVK